MRHGHEGKTWGTEAGAGHARAVAERDALQLRLGQLRGIFDSASEGMVTTDESQRIVMANQVVARMFRCRVQDLLGAPLERLMPQRFRADHSHDVAAFGAAEAAARPMGHGREVLGLRADGEEFPLEAGISQVHVDGMRLYTVILRDLTETRRMAAALRTSQGLMAATFDANVVPMAHIDPTTRRFVGVNPALCALTGYSRAELLTMGPEALDHPDSRLDAARFQAVLQGDKGYREVKRLVRKDGTVLWVQLNGSIVRDEEGRPYRVIGVVQDITARLEAEQALSRREARQAFLVRLNDRLRGLADAGSIAQEASALLAEFIGADRVGYAEDDGRGDTVTVAAAPARSGAPIDGRYRLADHDPESLGELRDGRTLVRPDLTRQPVPGEGADAAPAARRPGASVDVPLLGQGRLEAVFFVQTVVPRDWTGEEVALFEDVAQRLSADVGRARAQGALRAAKAMLEATFESMTDAVVTADLEGRLLDFNTAFARFHRFPGKAQTLRTLPEYTRILELSTPEGAPVTFEDWALPRALRGERGTNVEYGLRRVDTGETWVGSYSFAPIRDEHGAIVGAVAVGRDITEIKRIHADLQASHVELQRLMAAQDQVQERERARIARELHDELQQGLAAMAMRAAAARQRLRRPDSPTDRSLAGIGRIAADLIAATRRIVRDLRPQILEDLGLPAALEALAAQFTQELGIGCTVQAPVLGPETTARVAGVAQCLYRVAQEALNNVAKHAGARSVRMELHTVGRDTLVLSIADDGVGMPRVPGEGGMHFGLLGMRERLRAVGGHLRVVSRTGEGTTLEATVPLPAA